MFMKKILFLILLYSVPFTAFPQTNMWNELNIKSISKWCFGVDGGVAYFIEPIGGISGDINTGHAQKLRLGTSYGTKICYYFMGSDDNDCDVGAGLMIRNTHTSHTTVYKITEENGNETLGSLTDNINLLFIAPMFSIHPYFDNRNSICFNMAPYAFVSYSNNAMLIERYKLSNRTRGIGTTGMILDLEYIRSITNHLSLETGFYFNAFHFSEYTKKSSKGIEETIKMDESEGLAHISLSLGLSYFF